MSQYKPFFSSNGTLMQFSGPPVSRLNGWQVEFQFPNGYGASVIQHAGSYGSERGLFELAVLGQDGTLTYTTPITDDVLGHLSEPQVTALLLCIRQLDTLPDATIAAEVALALGNSNDDDDDDDIFERASKVLASIAAMLNADYIEYDD